MRLGKMVLVLFSIGLSSQSLAWGPTGHRIVAEIAQRHLTPKAASIVKKILNGHRLPDGSNWADDIRSDDNFKLLPPYHFADIPPGFKSYDEAPKSPKGDAVVAISVLVEILKTGKMEALNKAPAFSQITKEQALKLLVHFVGDIHQPLHTGDPADKGGNDVKVYFMNTRTESNLHAVWDSDIIDFTKLSFTEYATIIDHASKSDQKAWSSLNPSEWASEGISVRSQIYIYPDKQPEAGIAPKSLPLIGYVYIYKNRDLLEKRLLQGGIRLAHLLNSIFF